MDQATGNETACAFGAEFLWPEAAPHHGGTVNPQSGDVDDCYSGPLGGEFRYCCSEPDFCGWKFFYYIM